MMTNVVRLYAASINWGSISESMTWQAEWRRGKAAEYPHDAYRNLRAAQALESLATAILKPEFARARHLLDQCPYPDVLSLEIDGYLADVRISADPEEFFRWMLRCVERSRGLD